MGDPESTGAPRAGKKDDGPSSTVGDCRVIPRTYQDGESSDGPSGCDGDVFLGGRVSSKDGPTYPTAPVATSPAVVGVDFLFKQIYTVTGKPLETRPWSAFRYNTRTRVK